MYIKTFESFMDSDMFPEQKVKVLFTIQNGKFKIGKIDSKISGAKYKANTADIKKSIPSLLENVFLSNFNEIKSTFPDLTDDELKSNSENVFGNDSVSIKKISELLSNEKISGHLMLFYNKRDVTPEMQGKEFVFDEEADYGELVLNNTEMDFYNIKNESLPNTIMAK